MARAVIEIAGDTTQLVRALNRIPKAVQTAASSVRNEFASALHAAEEASNRAAKAAEEAAAKMRAANRAMSSAARDGASERTRAEQVEAGYREAGMRAEVAAVERAEAAKTRATRRASEERQRIYAREIEARRRAAGEFGERAAGLAMQAGHAAIGMTRTAVNTAAGIETTMNNALVPAGYRDPGELASAQRAILERARASGIDSAQLSAGLASAQEATSLLSGGNARDRSAALASALDTAEFAANSRQDVGQVLRLQGVLAQQGVRGRDARSTIMALTGIGRAGSIELGNLTREALGPLMQNIAFATGRLGPGATEQQRAEAVRRATVRTLAVGEVGAAAGLSSRDALNALAKLDRYTLNPVAMGNLRDRLMARGAAGRTLAGEMFEQTRDAGGQQIYRLRGAYQDSLVMSSALLRHTGGDSAALANMLASSGPGRAMVMDSQTRRLLLGLSSQTANGESISQRVQRMAGEANYTEADLAAERQIRMGEQTTRITTNAETQRQALTDNTDALNQLNKRLEDAQAKHPLLMAAAGGGLTAAAPTIGRSIMQTLTGAGSAAVGGVGRFAARAIARGTGVIGALSDILKPMNEDQGYFDDAAAIRAHRGGTTDAQAARLGNAAGQRNSFADFQNGMRTAVAQGIREGMATAPVQIPPAAQQQTQTQQALNSGATPTTGR